MIECVVHRQTSEFDYFVLGLLIVSFSYDLNTGSVLRIQGADVDLSQLPLADELSLHILIVQGSTTAPSILVTVPRADTSRCFGTCTDGVRNGAETGIDCGGACGPCPTQMLPSGQTTVRPTLPTGGTNGVSLTGNAIGDSLQTTGSMGVTGATDRQTDRQTDTDDNVQRGAPNADNNVVVIALAASLGIVCCILCVVVALVLWRRRRDTGDPSQTMHMNDHVEMHSARVSGLARESSIDQQYGSTGLIAAQQRNAAVGDTVNSASSGGDHYMPMAMRGQQGSPVDEHSTYGTLQMTPATTVQVGAYTAPDSRICQ